MKRYRSVDTAALTREINRLGSEIATLTQNNIERAIRAGELLSEVKIRVGQGNWRPWLEKNLSFSIRTASRYILYFNQRDELLGVKNTREAQAILAKRERGRDAIGADFSKIRKAVVGHVRLARRNLQRFTYTGDSPEMIEQILGELRAETQALLAEIDE